jgi:hypothetical protein
VSNYTRAQDIRITLRRDGEPVVPLSVNSGSWDPGLDVETFMVAGQAEPEVDGINTVCKLELDLNIRNPDYHAVLDAQRAKNRGEAAYRDMVIDAEFVVSFGAQGRARYLLPDCTAHAGSTKWSGGTERVTDSVTLTGSKPKRLS